MYMVGCLVQACLAVKGEDDPAMNECISLSVEAARLSDAVVEQSY